MAYRDRIVGNILEMKFALVSCGAHPICIGVVRKICYVLVVYWSNKDKTTFRKANTHSVWRCCFCCYCCCCWVVLCARGKCACIALLIELDVSLYLIFLSFLFFPFGRCILSFWMFDILWKVSFCAKQQTLYNTWIFDVVFWMMFKVYIYIYLWWVFLWGTMAK